jgi:uncharacterized membrane protein HdeD (DUF308 family)
MNKKIIYILYGLPFLLIGLTVFVKSLELFFIPNWVLGVILVWGAIGFFVGAMREKRNNWSLFAELLFFIRKKKKMNLK